MKHIKTFLEKKKTKESTIQDDIKFVRNISKEHKEEALKYLQSYSKASKGKITGLTQHPELSKRISEKGLPSGFDMGIDEDGYYIHTHRARSKSHESVDGITQKEIKFIDSTG